MSKDNPADPWSLDKYEKELLQGIIDSMRDQCLDGSLPKDFTIYEWDIMKEKPIWPNYELGYDIDRAGLMTYVRKQDPDGVWQLIPVVQRYEFGEDKSNQVDRLFEFIKRFNTECYKVLLFWRFPEKGKELIDVYGKPVGGTPDTNQQSEKDRLIPYLKDKSNG